MNAFPMLISNEIYAETLQAEFDAEKAYRKAALLRRQWNVVKDFHDALDELCEVDLATHGH